jgi:hypothetical protein
MFIDRTDEEQDVGIARENSVSFLMRWWIMFLAHRFSAHLDALGVVYQTF